MNYSKVLIFILLLYNYLFGYDDFRYNISTNQKKAVVKEPVIVSIQMQQKSADESMSFVVTFLNSSEYRYELLESVGKKDAKDRSLVTSKYAIYPLKEGKLHITPSLTVKYASKEEVKKFVTGSADELTYLQTRDKKVTLPPIVLNVKKPDVSTKLIGDYKLTYSIDKQRLKRGEQVNLTYTIQGRGSKIEIDDLIGNIEGCEIFRDKQIYNNKLFHKVTYSYALIPQKEFKLPKISLLAYNPKKRTYYKLTTPSVDISVAEQSTAKPLVLNEKKRLDFNKILTLVLIFTAGYFSAKILGSKKLTPKEQFIRKVKKSRDAKELLKLLLSYEENTFEIQIKKLEEMLYGGKSYRLSGIKGEVIKSFPNSQTPPYSPPKSHQAYL